jgi:hypothetical protein
MNDQPTDGGAEQSGPSPAQVSANRRNASRSTGPRTAAGKAQSARNSAKHGRYALTSVAITVGPFAEDPDEVQGFLDEIIKDLDPRDSVERAHAERIAQIHLQEARIDRWETAALNGTVRRKNKPQLLVAHEWVYPLIDHIAEWNAERPGAAGVRTGTVTDDGERPWELMAQWLRSANMPRITEASLRDDPKEPMGTKKWRRAFEALAVHIFPEPGLLGAWLMHRNAAMAEAEDHLRVEEETDAAVLSLNVTPPLLAQRTRITREVGQRMNMYQILRSRPCVSGLGPGLGVPVVVAELPRRCRRIRLDGAQGHLGDRCEVGGHVLVVRLDQSEEFRGRDPQALCELPDPHWPTVSP